MEQEKTISGYCQYLDQSRIVLVELTDGEVTDVDCCYGSCPHQSSCLIAKEIDGLQSDH